MIPGDGISKKSGDVAIALLESHGTELSAEELSYLGAVKHWPNVWGECVSALLLQRSLLKHADALNAAAEASNRHGKSLVWATWALVVATISLVFVGVV